MKNKHITEILDRTPFSALDEQDRATVAAHAAGCAECRLAFEAARLSAVLLKAETEIKPSPFFQARVMNAWRERQQEAAAALRPFLAFRRWWQASAAPVFLMLTTLAVLISLTLLAPQSSADDSMEISEFNLYSTDAVILNQRPRDLTPEQVFEVIYTNSKNDQRSNQKK